MPAVGVGALSVAANAKSADQLSGTDLAFAPFSGVLELYTKASADGLNVTLTVGGDSVINDQEIPFTGTAGTLSTADNLYDKVLVAAGSKLTLTYRNTTGVAITSDALVRLVPV